MEADCRYWGIYGAYVGVVARDQSRRRLKMRPSTGRRGKSGNGRPRKFPKFTFPYAFCVFSKTPPKSRPQTTHMTHRTVWRTTPIPASRTRLPEGDSESSPRSAQTAGIALSGPRESFHMELELRSRGQWRGKPLHRREHHSPATAAARPPKVPGYRWGRTLGGRHVFLRDADRPLRLARTRSGHVLLITEAHLRLRRAALAERTDPALTPCGLHARTHN